MSKSIEYGDVVSSIPILFPSTLNWTPATPTLSLAVAVIEMVPETSALFEGDVIETVGGVVSSGICCYPFSNKLPFK